jgi:isopentenyldiphosphate isomerase
MNKINFINLQQKKMGTEFFPLVDENGEVTGKASREICHNKSFLLHPVVHLHVINSHRELYLQKRADNKDVQPGKWDTAVGGHVDYGETIADALIREASEELGINRFSPVFMVRYKFTSEVESELVHSYYTIHDEKIVPDPTEISDGRFWSFTEIMANMGKGIFTPNFEYEFNYLVRNRLLPVTGI